MAKQWIEVEIEEPFPVFYAHTSHTSERSRATAQGPFYNAHSKTYHLPTQANRDWAEWSARGLRDAGWTVHVREVTR